jgi:hypothetical protein
MAYNREWVVDLLRKNGYPAEADEVLRTMPDEIERAQMVEFADKHNIFVDEMINRMGGSP